MLAPGGRIVVCGAHSLDANAWKPAFERVTNAYSSGGEHGHRRAHERFFEASAFAVVDNVTVQFRQRIDVDALVERALTRSTTSPAVLGDRIEAFRAELAAALAPFFPDGEAQEVLEARARIWARKA
jgi:hypothetical protein